MLRISAITVSDSVAYVETSKMKILGVKHWRIMMPNKIHSREYSKDGDTDGASYATATLMAICMSVTSTGTATGGTGTTTGSTTIGTATILRLCAQLSSFSPRISGVEF